MKNGISDPYQLVTNGLEECFVQSFKQALEVENNSGQAFQQSVCIFPPSHIVVHRTV